MQVDDRSSDELTSKTQRTTALRTQYLVLTVIGLLGKETPTQPYTGNGLLIRRPSDRFHTRSNKSEDIELDIRYGYTLLCEMVISFTNVWWLFQVRCASSLCTTRCGGFSIRAYRRLSHPFSLRFWRTGQQPNCACLREHKLVGHCWIKGLKTTVCQIWDALCQYRLHYMLKSQLW